MADDPEEPIILESAHLHGVNEHDMLHAVRCAIHHVKQADDMVMFIGLNAAGAPIEVEVVIS